MKYLIQLGVTQSRSKLDFLEMKKFQLTTPATRLGESGVW